MLHEETGILANVSQPVQVGDYTKVMITLQQIEQGASRTFERWLELEVFGSDRIKQVAEPARAFIGQQVKVYFYINGRKWTPKDGGEQRIFMSLSCNLVEPLQQIQPQVMAAPAPVDYPTQNDIPF